MSPPSTLSTAFLTMKGQANKKPSRYQRLKDIYVHDIKPCIPAKIDLDEEYNFTSGPRRGYVPEYARTPSSSRSSMSLDTSVMAGKN
jgi:hypothetical protein